MLTSNIWLLIAGGFISGILAGLLGIGGGTIIVPLLVALGLSPVQSVATSNLTILITSLSGTLQNWRSGYMDLRRVIYLGLPAILTAKIGVLLSTWVHSFILLSSFGILLIINIYLISLRSQLTEEGIGDRSHPIHPTLTTLAIGSFSGIFAGFLGIGGGVILVPLQLLLLGNNLKSAVQSSLGVVTITAMSALISRGLNEQILLNVGLCLGLGGVLGSQVSTRLLPLIPEERIAIIFKSLLLGLAIYIFAQAWQSYLLHI